MGWWGTSCLTSLIFKKTNMEYTNVKYGLLLSEDQLAVLGNLRGYNRMYVYKAICKKTAIEPYDLVQRGIKIHVNRGECLYPIQRMEKDLNMNRKTIQEIIHQLNMVGVIKSTSDNRGTVHINQSLAFWMLGDLKTTIQNPLYSRNPSCQATKGIKAKSSKDTDSIKESLKHSPLFSSNRDSSSVPVSESAPISSAELLVEEHISSPSPSVSVSEKSPSLCVDKNKSADQQRNSSKFAKAHNLHQKHFGNKHKH